MLAMSTLMMPAPTMTLGAPQLAVGPHKPPEAKLLTIHPAQTQQTTPQHQLQAQQQSQQQTNVTNKAGKGFTKQLLFFLTFSFFCHSVVHLTRCLFRKSTFCNILHTTTHIIRREHVALCVFTWLCIKQKYIERLVRAVDGIYMMFCIYTKKTKFV